MISAFLNHLETERHNSIRTRNVRLTAIRSLFSYAALRHPEHALLIQRVLAIPPKRFDKRIVTFLTAAEVDALIAAPDQTRWEGRRDRALHAAGRPDRPAGLRTHRPELRRRHPRRRRQRPLRRQGPQTTRRPPHRPRRGAAASLADRASRATRRPAVPAPAPAGGSAATPSRCASAPTPRPPRNDARRCWASEIHPHVLRHSCAMSLLQAGVDTSVIALWLGHAGVRSTDAYLHADMTIKEKALALTTPATARPGRYRPPDKVLAFLESL